MNAFTSAVLEVLAEQATTGGQGGANVSGLHLRLFPNFVLNIDNDVREVTNADLDDLRDALTGLGYREVESWVAWQNASWMSDGMFAGVSFRIARAEARS